MLIFRFTFESEYESACILKNASASELLAIIALSLLLMLTLFVVLVIITLYPSSLRAFSNNRATFKANSDSFCFVEIPVAPVVTLALVSVAPGPIGSLDESPLV